MTEFIRALKNEMPKPTWFGWYHLLWLSIMLTACILIYIFRHRLNHRTVNIILLVFGIVLFLLEALKQIERSVSIGNADILNWHYPPSDFPFQFCSTPMYLMLLAGILRKGRFYETLLCYLSTYALFGGAIVMVYPLGVYVSSIFINVHTMIWHSSIVIVGFTIFATRSVAFNMKSLLKATIIFSIILVIAILMNVFAHLIVPDEYFNMFYIGPYYPNNFVVLQDIYQHVPWIVFILIYAIGFALASLIVMLIAVLWDKLVRKIHECANENVK